MDMYGMYRSFYFSVTAVSAFQSSLALISVFCISLATILVDLLV